jgi:hypothetical protein
MITLKVVRFLTPTVKVVTILKFKLRAMLAFRGSNVIMVAPHPDVSLSSMAVLTPLV